MTSLYGRDIWMISWSFLKVQLNCLVFSKWLNTIHSSIKFVETHDNSKINFLDTYIYKDEQYRLAFKTYKNPTDKNSLLHYTSHHSRSLIKNLPYGQLLRLKRNSTLIQDFIQEEDQFTKQLRGYPLKVIQNAKTGFCGGKKVPFN